MVQLPTLPTTGSYSADVRIDLHVNGDRIPVAQMGGPELLFHRHAVLHHDHGTVVMTIDGQEFKWHARFAPTTTPVDAIEATLTAIDPEA